MADRSFTTQPDRKTECELCGGPLESDTEQTTGVCNDCAGRE